MTQLIIGGITLPQTSGDKYSCWEEPLSVSVTMASGRQVSELRGKVYRVKWSYDYLPQDMMASLMAVLRSGQPVSANFLPLGSDELLTSTFWVSKVDNPAFAFSHDGSALWHDIGFELREVSPHD